MLEGHPASDYEPHDWPKNAITPDPYAHLTHKQGGGSNEHNDIEGALGVQSASIPWDYRHYSGNLNSHRKAEPLIYTPLVLAKSHDGTSAIDLTSIVNRKYQSQRMSSNPQYANTLSALTDYKPVQLHPTDHWLPQIPTAKAPGVKQKFWEKHFLDLYAPTPPPLLSPIPPQMKKKGVVTKSAASLLESSSTVELPDILSHGEHIQSMITPVYDENHQSIPFHNSEIESQQQRDSVEIDQFALAGHDAEPVFTAFLQENEIIEEEEETSAMEVTPESVFDTSLPFPPAKEELFPW